MNAPHQPSPDLLAAVEAAYRAFASERVGTRLNVCRCNVCFGSDREIEDILVRTSLREISAKHLAEYTNSAHGWDNEMLYFLPRYLDLIARDDPPSYLDSAYVLRRLGGIDWHATWPADRIEAVEAFFDALAADIVLRDPAPPFQSGPDGYYQYSELGDALYLIGNGGGDLTRVLAKLEALAGSSVDLHIAILVIDFSRKLFDNAGSNTLGAATDRAVVDWLLQDAMRRRLTTAFFAASAPEALNTLSLAVAALEGALAQRASNR